VDGISDKVCLRNGRVRGFKMVFGCSFGKVEGFSGLDVFVEEVRFGGYDI